MQIGDKVQVTGVVKDMVGGSTLIGGDPDGREYWVLDANVALQSQLTQAEQAEAAKEAAASNPPAKPAATTHTTASKH